MRDNDTIECIYNFLKSLCAELDFLADPLIEENMVCSLDCCIGNSIFQYFESIQGRGRWGNTTDENTTTLYQIIIGAEGIKMADEFEKLLSEKGLYYDGKPGFSQEPRWKELSTLAQQLSEHIKNSLDNILLGLVTRSYMTGEVLRTLLSRGANVNARDDAGNTPLHRMVAEYYLCVDWYVDSMQELVQILIAHGADVNAQNKEGETPLSMLEHQIDCVSDPFLGSYSRKGIEAYEGIKKLLIAHGARK